MDIIAWLFDWLSIVLCGVAKYIALHYDIMKRCSIVKYSRSVRALNDIECLVDLRTGIYVQKEVLGKQFNIEINGLCGVIQFPCIDDNASEVGLHGILLPPDNKVWSGECLGCQYWGCVMNYPGCESEIRKVGMCFLTPENKHIRKDIEQFIDGFSDMWVRKFVDYCDIISRAYMFTPEVRAKERYLTVLHPEYHQSYETEISVVMRDKWLSSDEIERAVNFASDRSKYLPLSFELILAAQRAFADDNYRLAIFEAGCSADACFDDLEKKCKFSNCGRREWGCLTLGQKFGKIICNIENFPYDAKSFKARILNPRNGIVHNKDFFRKPFRQDAMRMIESVEALLKYAYPQIYQ